MPMLVRLKPYDPQRGHLKKDYTFRGQRYESNRWYEVDDSIAAELSEVHQHEIRPYSPMAFDVMSRADAVMMEHEERRKKLEEVATPAETPIKVIGGGDLTTADLRPPTPPAPAFVVPPGMTLTLTPTPVPVVAPVSDPAPAPVLAAPAAPRPAVPVPPAPPPPRPRKMRPAAAGAAPGPVSEPSAPTASPPASMSPPSRQGGVT